MSNDTWTEKEDKLLIKLYNTTTLAEIIRRLNKTESKVRTRISKVVTIESRSGYQWSQIEDDLLSQHYGNMPIEELSKLILRTPRAILDRVKRVEGVSSRSLVSGNFTTEEVALYLGKDKSTIRKYARNGKINMFMIGSLYYIKQEDFWDWLKNNTSFIKSEGIVDSDIIGTPEWYRNYIAKDKHKQGDIRKQIPFSSTEDALIWRLYTNGMKIEDITSNTKRTYDSVQHRLRKLRKMKWN